MPEVNPTNPAMKLYKATVVVSREVEEVPVWAKNIDEALSNAEATYGEVQGIRSTPHGL